LSLAFRRLNKNLDDKDDVSSSIRRSVIPAVCYLQRSRPQETFIAVLGLDLVTPLMSTLQLDPAFSCVDLRSSDIFFDSLKKK
jgi:hypothetical protein